MIRAVLRSGAWLILLVLSFGVVAPASGSASARPAMLFVTPGGSDTGGCTRKAPCRSFAHAFATAPPGASVTVARGDYTTCEPITGSKRKFVTFVGIRGARVVCPLLFEHANHVEIRGVTLYQVITADSSYLRFSSLAITCSDSAPYALIPPAQLCDARLSLNDSDHLEFTDLSVGPTYDSSACGGEQTNVAFGLTNTTFKRVTFKDVRWQAAPCGGGDGTDNQHSENFYFSGNGSPAMAVVFDSCRFTNGPKSGRVVSGPAADGRGPNSASLFLTGKFSGLTVRNCVFDGVGGPAIDGASDADIVNSLIENNTWTRPAIFQYASYPSLSLINNLGAQQTCPISGSLGSSGGTFSHNLWYYGGSGGSADHCSKTDITVNGPGVEKSIFANYSAGNLRLKRGSPAVGRADPDRYPARDRAGVARPQGKRADIGAFELPLKAKPKSKKKPKSATKSKP